MTTAPQSAATPCALKVPVRLYTELRLTVHLRQVVLKDRFRHVDRREHVGDQTNGQGDGEALDWPGAEHKQEQGGYDRGYVRVDDGQKCLVETRLNGRPGGFSVAQFLADAFEDQHVGIDAHADGQNHARD